MIVRSNKSHLEEWIIHFGMTPFPITSIYCLKPFIYVSQYQRFLCYAIDPASRAGEW